MWKTTGKDSSEACAIACQNCAVYSIFPSRMTSLSNIAQFTWECIGRFRRHRRNFRRHGDLAPGISDLWVKTLLFSVLQPTGITGASQLTNRISSDHLVVSSIGRMPKAEENKLQTPDVEIRDVWVLLTWDYVPATAVVIVRLWAQLETFEMKL